jgi:hypothetical protein
MEHFVDEFYLWGLSWIFLRKLELKFKEAAIPSSTFRTLNESSPN